MSKFKHTVLRFNFKLGKKCSLYLKIILTSWFNLAPSGSYSLKNAFVCESCSAGYECPDTDKDVEYECGEGEFSFGGQKECTQCEAGSKCPAKDGSGNAYCLPVSCIIILANFYQVLDMKIVFIKFSIVLSYDLTLSVLAPFFI